MRLIVANWKMHKTRAEAAAYGAELSGRIGHGIAGRELVLAPSFPALSEARDPRGRWELACQNVAAEKEGAFTGEVSARQAADAGCRYAIVGHSERRRLFAEDGPTLAKKLARCREAALTPIYCLGETAEERDASLTASTLVRQVDTLAGDPPELPLVVAYEPVWAIGTGKVASAADAQEVCAAVRATLAELASPEVADAVRVLYGGSVNAKNVGELVAQPDIDGGLVGGASLKADEFAQLSAIAAGGPL